jgi:DNA-binding XRE family transcriptional regulator
MARACGVSKHTWINYEQGVSDIPTMRLISVSIYCCVDIVSLLANFMPETKIPKPKLSNKLHEGCNQ